MKIYHLSHTDLDGYACQFVVNFYFKNVVFLNSNYGREISDTFAMILSRIEKDLTRNPNEKFLVLISDLNLNLTQCEDFEKPCKAKMLNSCCLTIIKAAWSVRKSMSGIF